MSNQKTFDPYESLHRFSLLWEKQINDFIYLWTNNQDFVKVSNYGTEIHSRYLEAFKKNQEALANVLNLPTKSDITNVANLTIQTEEKIDTLEEQVWELQAAVNSQSKELESVVEISGEIIKLTKQLKTELVKTKKELAEARDISAELQEIKLELLKLTKFKEELEPEIAIKEEAKEPVLTGSGSSK